MAYLQIDDAWLEQQLQLVLGDGGTRMNVFVAELPDPGGSQTLFEVLSEGNDAGDLEILNLSALRSEGAFLLQYGDVNVDAGTFDVVATDGVLIQGGVTGAELLATGGSTARVRSTTGSVNLEVQFGGLGIPSNVPVLFLFPNTEPNVGDAIRYNGANQLVWAP